MVSSLSFSGQRDQTICEKIYQNGGTTLAETVLKEHLISPETAESHEMNAAIQAARTLDCVASCGAGLSTEVMRQVLDMATAHLFGGSSGNGLDPEDRLVLMRAVVSIHAQSAIMSNEAALDMDRKGIIKHLINAIAEEGMYSKDAPLMKSMLSLLHTVTNSVTAIGNVVNVKANVALDLVSTAVGYHPELATEENNYLISTLVNKEDIAKYAEVAQSNLNAVIADGAAPSIANVSALAASIETLASMSGAFYILFVLLCLYR